MYKEILEKIDRKLKIQGDIEADIRSKDIEEEEKTKIEFRVTQTEKDIIKSMAKLKRMTVSQFIRYVLLDIYMNNVIKL